MTAAAKLKKARATLDNRVERYIKRYGSRGCRLMNLTCNHGTEKQKCHIPDLIWIDSHRRLDGIGDYSRRETIMIAALKRMKRQGRIRCDKRGTPSWTVVPENDRWGLVISMQTESMLVREAKELAAKPKKRLRRGE